MAECQAKGLDDFYRIPLSPTSNRSLLVPLGIQGSRAWIHVHPFGVDQNMLEGASNNSGINTLKNVEADQSLNSEIFIPTLPPRENRLVNKNHLPKGTCFTSCLLMYICFTAAFWVSLDISPRKKVPLSVQGNNANLLSSAHISSRSWSKQTQK